MQWHRIAFAAMLILALVPAFSVTQLNVWSQGYVTVTSQTTMTGLYTSAATTSYETTVLTTTNTYFSGIVIPSFNPGTDPKCGWVWKSFTANKGESVSVSLTSATPVTFYVMSYAVRNSWRVDGHPVDIGSPDSYSPCHGAPDGSLIVQDGITHYSYDGLVFPADSNYWLLFLQIGSPSEISVNFEMLSSPTVATSTVSSISYTAAPTTELLAFTSLITQATPPFAPFGDLRLIGLAVILVMIVIIVVVLLHRRRRGWSATKVYDQVVTVPVSRVEEDAGVPEATRTIARAETNEADDDLASNYRGKMETASIIYCPECGTENLSDSRFCRKCATRIDSSSK
jgi:hypothetical protein